MWAVLRKYRKVWTNVLIIIALLLFIVEFKQNRFLLSSSNYNFKPRFTAVKHYAQIFDFLHSINVTAVILDPNLLGMGEVDETFVTFGLFEKQAYQLKKAAERGLVPKGWVYQEHQQIDYRLMHVLKVRSHTNAHFTFTSPHVGTLHLAVIFPRSHDYYWLSEFNDHQFGARNFTIPLPMAVERFTCDNINISAYHTMCLIKERRHYLWQLPYAKFLECHYEDVVWRFEREHPLEKIDTRNHAKGIHEMMRIARKHEVPILMAYGSLLGWYRQCDYIVHSKDIDTLMFASDFSEELFRDLWFSPILRMYVRLGTYEEGLEFRFFAAGTVWFDLFLIYPRGDIYNTYMIHTILLELHRSTYPKLTDICSADLLGVLVYIPCDPMKYILTEYGADNWYDFKTYRYLNIDVVYHYNSTEEAYSNIHNYKKDCKNPQIMYGCDGPPTPSVNSSL